jgi:hypothetical protein
MNTTSSPSSSSSRPPAGFNLFEIDDGEDYPEYKIKQFQHVLNAPNVDLNALRALAWNGVPMQFRATTWQLLLGYLPCNRARRSTTLKRKRKEYHDSLPLYFDISDKQKSTAELAASRQIKVDLHRTFPMLPFFHQPVIQRAMERVLYMWSMRHPASGYVQGMNDVLAPCLLVCLQPYVCGEVLRSDVAQIREETVNDVEADTYYTLGLVLNGIQDHYTPHQLGIQRMVQRLEDLTSRIDSDLHGHFMKQDVCYIQFAFRWANCLLLRELPLRVIIRMWDSCIAEGETGFEQFITYICVVILQTFRHEV